MCQVYEDPGKSLLLRLFEIAFHSRLSLPLMISAGFMIFNSQVRIEFEFDARIENLQDEEEHHHVR